MYSKMKIMGHPIHPMLIAYPVALYTATLVGFVIYGVTDDRFWLRFSIATNVAGVGMAVIAALPGFIDWAIGIPRGTEAKRTGLQHMLLNYTALAAFVINMIVYLDAWNGAPEPSSTGLILSAIGVGITIMAGFLGWKLVQDHHVGVRLMPEQETLERESMHMRRAG